jgi:hypothetical protein
MFSFGYLIYKMAHRLLGIRPQSAAIADSRIPSDARSVEIGRVDSETFVRPHSSIHSPLSPVLSVKYGFFQSSLISLAIKESERVCVLTVDIVFFSKSLKLSVFSCECS